MLREATVSNIVKVLVTVWMPAYIVYSYITCISWIIHTRHLINTRAGSQDAVAAYSVRDNANAVCAALIIFAEAIFVANANMCHLCGESPILRRKIV